MKSTLTVIKLPSNRVKCEFGLISEYNEGTIMLKKKGIGLIFFLCVLLLSVFIAMYYRYEHQMTHRELTRRQSNLEEMYKAMKVWGVPPLHSLYEMSKECRMPVNYFIYHYDPPRNTIEEPFPKNPTQKEFDQLCQYTLVHLKDGKWYIVELVNGYRIKKRFLITNEGTIREADSNP